MEYRDPQTTYNCYFNLFFLFQIFQSSVGFSPVRFHACGPYLRRFQLPFVVMRIQTLPVHVFGRQISQITGICISEIQNAPRGPRENCSHCYIAIVIVRLQYQSIRITRAARQQIFSLRKWSRKCVIPIRLHLQDTRLANATLRPLQNPSHSISYLLVSIASYQMPSSKISCICEVKETTHIYLIISLLEQFRFFVLCVVVRTTQTRRRDYIYGIADWVYFLVLLALRPPVTPHNGSPEEVKEAKQKSTKSFIYIEKEKNIPAKVAMLMTGKDV